MGNRTPLYQKHLDSNAKLVDFSGWDMPIHYGSQMDEHRIVRSDAGMFDVSHMVVIDCQGEGSKDWLQHLLANDVGKLTTTGKALYSCMLNEDGGIIDDLIVYYIKDNHYRIVVNAGTGSDDLAWMLQQSSGYVMELTERDDLAMIAVQGPTARDKVASLFSLQEQENLKALAVFTSMTVAEYFVARTGYTGEDGFEITLPASLAGEFWQSLLDIGVSPCGLGARDTLRLEAGMNLYGSDMNQSVTPLESGLSWTVDWEPAERVFIGKEALLKQRQSGVPEKLIGFVLQGRGVLRDHQEILCNDEIVGEVTSGTFSPTMKSSIAMARVKATVCEQYNVDIRGKQIPLLKIKMPFVRNGKVLVTI